MRVFQRLLKQSRTGAAGRKKLGWEKRLRRLEEALLEANALRVREINESCRKDGREPSDSESDFLGSAEDFRRHLTEMLKVSAREEDYGGL